MRLTPAAALITGLSSLFILASPAAPQDPHGPPPPPAPVAPTAPVAPRLELSPEAGAQDIPFDLYSNHIYLRGRVNDSDSLWIVLDSGAGGNVVNASVADRLGLVSEGSTQARGAGGVVASGRVSEVTFRLPGVTLSGPSATIPMDDLVRQSSRAMDGIVGQTLLSRCVARIDYAAHTLDILDAESFHYSGHGTILPLTFEHGLPYVTARLTVPGHAPIKGRFVIDTGSGQSLILTAPFVHKHHVDQAVPKTIQVRGRGVGGQVQSLMGRLTALELGDIRIERPVAALRMSDVGTISAQGTVGNIGGEILRRFTVTFDYPHQRMILEPNQRLGEPLEADMSGLGLRPGPADSHALEVEWLQPDAPAIEAGVREGDLIESVDGRPATELGISGLQPMFRRDGETHRLTIRRGEEHLEITFTTRRLI